MRVDQRLVDAAIKQALERWPDEEAGAAAAYTADGQILTSVCVETPNSVVNLCHETGAICEAHKLNVAVAASVCVSREDKDAPTTWSARLLRGAVEWPVPQATSSAFVPSPRCSPRGARTSSWTRGRYVL